MLVIFAFPIADVRSFVATETYMLKKPPVPAVPGKHFVRNTGEVSIRLKGGSQVAAGEDMFCCAKGACRLPMDPRWQNVEIDGHLLDIQCIHRRYYRTGHATARFEIAFRVICKTRDGETKVDASKVVDAISQIKVRVGLSEDKSGTSHHRLSQIGNLLKVRVGLSEDKSGTSHHRLSQIGNLLADHFRLASTKMGKKKIQHSERCLCIAGDPVVAVELRDNESFSPPEAGTSLENLRDDTKVCFRNIDLGNRAAPVLCWFLSKGNSVNPGSFRQLRMHLLRVHAEMQCLARVVALEQTRWGRCSQLSTLGELESYLTRVRTLLQKEKRYGTPQRTIIDTAYENVNAARPGAWKTLWDATEQLLKRIRELKLKFSEPAFINPVSSPTQWVTIVGAVFGGLAFIFIVAIVVWQIYCGNSGLAEYWSRALSWESSFCGFRHRGGNGVIHEFFGRCSNYRG